MTSRLLGPLLASRQRFFAIAFVCVVPLVVLFPMDVAAQQTLLYTSGGYGAYAFLGSAIDVPKSAPSAIGPGCGTAQVGASAVGSVPSLHAAPLVQTAANNTSAASSSGAVRGSADVHSINVLQGLITASEIVMVSTSLLDSHGTLRTSTSGSNLVNLVVSGTAITSMPAPNTTVTLPGFGRVVLNEQSLSSSSGRIELTLNMIHVYVTVANSLGVTVGTQIIVADAYSGLMVIPGPAALDGNALGSSITSSTINSRPSAALSVGCGATRPKTVTLPGLNVPQILNLGMISDFGEGLVSTGQTLSHTSSTVNSVNVLNGLVTADLVQDDTSASTTDGTTFTFNQSGSYVNLHVSGHPEITSDVPPNTKVTLAGVGTLWLHLIVSSPNLVEVHMIELVVGPNSLGLPVGMRINVCESEVRLHSLAHP